MCIYWYQAFECTLHNLTNDSCRLLTDEKFKSDYERKEFIMYMNTVENGVPLLTLYDTNGEKLQLFEPDEDAFPTVDKVCTLPIFTSELTVYVSHINTSCSIYIQQASDALILADLLEKMFEFYEENGDPAELEQYNLCCAKSSDGNWYRARIEEIMDDCTKVLYIDYGNGEEIPNKNLKQLIEQFYEPPEFALHVSMNLTEISEGFKDKLSEMTVDKELKCSIHFTDVWIVELFDGENNINQIMCESGLAQTMVEPVLCICPAKPKEERRSAILITHIDSPGEFYVQLKANENDIAMLQEDLQDKIETLPNLEGAELGSLCAAKYTVDELWYRAEVLDADSDITTVRFVDFGNTDVIDNTANNLKTLSSELLAVGKYAKKCSLNISPKSKTEEWSQEACDIFITEIEKHEYTLFADIVYQDEKNKHYVELYDQNDKNVAQLLLDGGFAEHITRDIEDNIANNTGFVSHLNTLSEFWIQLESSVPDLEMIVERMAGVDSFPDLQDLSPGKFFLNMV